MKCKNQTHYSIGRQIENNQKSDNSQLEKQTDIDFRRLGSTNIKKSTEIKDIKGYIEESG